MSADRSVPGGFAALLASGVLLAFADPIARPLGGAASLALVVAWYALGPIYAFAVGQIAVGALGDDWSIAYLALAQVVLFGVLVGPDLRTRRGRRLAIAAGGAAALLGAATYGAQVAWDATWASTVVLAGIVALLAYGLHRYELVATGGVTREQ